MNACTLLLAVVLMLAVVVNGRHHGRLDADLLDNGEEQIEHEVPREHTKQMRHRRKRWNMGYGYNYPPPRPYYPDERRDQPDLYPQILRVLEDISSYVRRPVQQPPQPIYIPYPVPYPVPQTCHCKISTDKKPQNETLPDVDSRVFPVMEDKNQNWGFLSNDDDFKDDGKDGKRDISFDPIKPIRSNQVTLPSVDHGSVQAGEEITTSAPKAGRTPTLSNLPELCNAAILSCCKLPQGPPQQKSCFTNFGCSMTYSNGKACSSASVARALDSFTQAYSPSPSN